MRRFLPVVIFGILAVLLISPVFAQTQPSRTQTQPAVLNALSERVGVPGLGLSSLIGWNWFFGTYEFVVSQGCLGAPPAEPGGGSQGWQRYILNYKGTEYVYLISDDAQYLVLCNEAALGTPVPSVTPVPAQPAATTVPPLVMMTSTPVQVSTSVQDACPLPPRLLPGLGRVAPGDPNWLHSAPTRSSAKIGEIAAGEMFTVLAGPSCDVPTGMNYWQVQYGNLTGWTSEGLNGVYWLDRAGGSAPFLVDSAARAVPADWVSEYFREGIREMVVSRDASMVAVIDLKNAVILYDPVTGALVRSISPNDLVTHIAISHDALFVATARPDSRVYLWDGQTAEEFGYVVHSGEISAMAFSPIEQETRVLAVGSKEGQIWLWSIPAVSPDSQPLARLQATGAVASLEFNAAATLLIARDSAGLVVGIWQIP